MPNLEIPEKLAPLLQKPKRFKIIYGGRGGGKSISVADILLMEAQTQGLKIGCFREFQNSIEDSVHALLLSEIDRVGFQNYKHTANEITSVNGACFKFGGLARNPDSIKSKHGFNRFWIEEAQTISYKSLELLTPTLREAGSECWFTLNRGSSADPISERFIKPFESELLANGYYEDDLHMVIEINYSDNPWFPKELEMERLADKERLSVAQYRHKWDGDYNDSVDNSIIPVEWFDSAIDAHKRLGFEPVGQKVVAHDPSDTGLDAKGYALRHGSVFIDIDYMSTGDSNDGCRWALEKAVNAQADVFEWDSSGLGASLKLQVSQALDGKRISYHAFNGAETPENPDAYYLPHDSDTKSNARTNKQTFRNRRAQHYWMLRDRFYNTYRAVHKGDYVDPDTMISISSEIPKLNEIRAEVCRIPQKPNGNGLIQILSKPEMLKLEIKSPNMADSMMMAMVTPKLHKKVVVKDVPMVNHYG